MSSSIQAGFRAPAGDPTFNSKQGYRRFGNLVIFDSKKGGEVSSSFFNTQAIFTNIQSVLVT